MGTFFQQHLTAIIITASVLLVGVIMVVVFLIMSNQPEVREGTISVPNREGEEVVVNDFISESKQNYQDVTVIAMGENYSIQYDKQNNIFQIALTLFDSSELDNLRRIAEDHLMNTLQVSEKDFCELNIVENVVDNGVVVLDQYAYSPISCQ